MTRIWILQARAEPDVRHAQAKMHIPRDHRGMRRGEAAADGEVVAADHFSLSLNRFIVGGEGWGEGVAFDRIGEQELRAPLTLHPLPRPGRGRGKSSELE